MQAYSVLKAQEICSHVVIDVRRTDSRLSCDVCLRAGGQSAFRQHQCRSLFITPGMGPPKMVNMEEEGLGDIRQIDGRHLGVQCQTIIHTASDQRLEVARACERCSP